MRSDGQCPKHFLHIVSPPSFETLNISARYVDLPISFIYDKNCFKIQSLTVVLYGQTIFEIITEYIRTFNLWYWETVPLQSKQNETKRKRFSCPVDPMKT